MLGDHCSCTQPDFLGEIPFGQKQQNMLKNDPKIGFFLYFKKMFPLIFAGNLLK